MAEAVSETDFGRELGLHELFYETMTDRFETSNYFEYAVLQSNGLVSLEHLQAALKVLVNFQPFLRMKVVEKIEKDRPPTYKASFEEPHTRLYYQPCEVDYTKVIRTRTRKSDDDLADIVREEEIFLSRKERYGDSPRWRVVFNMPEDKEEVNSESDDTHRYDLFFGMNHQFVDAVSGYDMVYRQLLPILNKIINDLPVDEIFLHPLEVTPPYEEEFLGDAHSAQKRPAWYAKAGMTMLRKVSKVLKSRHIGQPSIYSEGSPFLEEKGMGILNYTFREELVDRVLSGRKHYDVSVHSILLTGLSFATIKLLDELGLQIPKEIQSGWPIDSRKKISKYKSPQPLGMFIGTSGFSSMKVPKPYRLDKEVFWRKAKKIGRQVSKGAANQHEKIMLDLIAYLTEHIQYEGLGQFFNELGLKRHFGLSNLGKCSLGPDLDASLPKNVDALEMYFGLHGNGSANSGFPFFITAINHKRKIFFICCYNKMWMRKETAEKILKYAEDTLDQVC